ncbi:MAG TPA: CpsD/CapB family tyrosine-protein kinase [Polyangia bacterium]|nr:CpsD/CapB family tyrosine-protein kinase [Polyangia bacterium]
MSNSRRSGGGDGEQPPARVTQQRMPVPRDTVETQTQPPQRVTAERVSAPPLSERVTSERAAVAGPTDRVAADWNAAAAGPTERNIERVKPERERILTPRPGMDARPTQQMQQLPFGSSSARARALAESVLAEDGESGDDPTRMQSSAPGARFVSEQNIRTAIVPHATTRQRNLEPSPTQQLAAVEVEVQVGAPAAQPRTQVWVATHKPPADPDARLILVREPDSARAASFRVMRHRLAERGDPRVIAVTSAGPREGKTTCAANLALALGECNRARVLLIEANFRTPALAALFGFLPPECFSVQLQRHKENPQGAWSVVEILSPSLHVLAVKPESESRPLLDGPAFALAIDMLRHAGYDYIVIDTPPVIGVADVNLVEDAADGVLFTAWSRSTSARKLTQAVEQLSPAKLLGLALINT